LLIRQLDALSLCDAGADVPHDLFDVDVIAPWLRLRWLSPSIARATIGPASAAVEVSAAPFLIVIHRFSTF
jgi:hypothetical protein